MMGFLAMLFTFAVAAVGGFGAGALVLFWAVAFVALAIIATGVFCVIASVYAFHFVRGFVAT
jgi:hypothetical protein